MRKVLIFPIFILLFVGFHSSVRAQTATPSQSPEVIINGHKTRVINDSSEEFIKGLDQRKKLAPSGFNQKRCEAHVKVAGLREKSLAKRASNMQKRLDKIVTLVKSYYTTKLVPQGKTVSNYDTLVSVVDAKKAALAPLVAKVQTDSEVLTCEDDQAKTEFQTFRTDATALISAFKAYRLSVIDLIQAVRKANGSVSPSLSPTLTPEVTQ